MYTEALLDQLPVDSASAHALAELGGVKSPASNFTLTREDSGGLRRQTFAEALLEVGRDVAGEAQEVYEGAARTSVVRALE